MSAVRTPDEIAARCRQVRDSGDDIFGFRMQVLFAALDAEHAREFAKPDADLSDWAAKDAESAARKYLKFAFGKAIDHRGISAGRSVQKLAEYAWLLGKDELVEQMRDEDNYPLYGAPALVLFANALGESIPDDAKFARMARGLPCRPGCDEGCGA